MEPVQQNIQQDTQSRKTRILLGVSGSVATIKLENIINLILESQKYNLKVITTERAKHFFDFKDFNQKYKDIEFLEDKEEWGQWQKRGDPVLHIELRKWADIFVIAPTSANTLAKLSNLISDNLLTCVARAWDFRLNQSNKDISVGDQKIEKLLNKPIVLAPAMNTMMFDHPGTEEQIEKLKNWGYIVMETVEKLLACGDHGKGAMAEPQTIFNIIKQLDQYIQK